MYHTMLLAIHVFSSLLEKWNSPYISGQPPPPCDSFTLTPVGERRAALFGGSTGQGLSGSDLFIVDLRRHTVVSVEHVHMEYLCLGGRSPRGIW